MQVYTFGPTFRAENSHTSRHLAEFWVSDFFSFLNGKLLVVSIIYSPLLKIEPMTLVFLFLSLSV